MSPKDKERTLAQCVANLRALLFRYHGLPELPVLAVRPDRVFFGYRQEFVTALQASSAWE